ncbi:MAG TPA: AmmeMemoRadiSam system protein B [Prolixibacteraceae bacterium]|nr:AmmeMemoRadiSam system protein B [Prolixibacteraceae bacterium]
MFKPPQEIRKPFFAGKFYPSNKSDIESLMQKLLSAEEKNIDLSLSKKGLIGAIIPHAGYIYSGYQAVHVFEILKHYKQPIDTVVIVNPNHSGLGFGNLNQGCAKQWETPLGLVDVDTELSQKLDIECCEAAHEREHSGEVMLPFLQYFLPYKFKIAVITMNEQSFANAKLLAKKIATAAKQLNRKIFLLASTDFTHYESPQAGYANDQYVVEKILKLKSSAIEKKVKKHAISMCGYGPVMTMIEYAKICSNTPAINILKRGHSGEVYPSEKVVNYISFLCYQ